MMRDSSPLPKFNLMSSKVRLNKKVTILIFLLFIILVSTFELVMAFQGAHGENSKSSSSAKPKPTPNSNNNPGNKSQQNSKSSATKGSKAIPVAQIIIKSSPVACSIVLDGNVRGLTNQDGILNLDKIKPGEHVLTISKVGYNKEDRQLVLAANQSDVVQVSLTPLPVGLTVNANVPNAQIEVNGQIYHSPIVDLQLMPNYYQVKVSKPGYKTVATSVELLPAKSEKLTVSLVRISVEELLTQAESSFRRQRYNEVIPNCLDILSIQPESPRANYLLGQSYFNEGKYAESISYFARAIRLGEQIILPIKHHHTAGFSITSLSKSDDLCSGQLILRKGVFEFQSSNSKDSFVTTPVKIYELSIDQYKRTTARLHTQVGILKGKKEDKKDYNFLATQTDLRKRDPNNANSLVDVYCQSCEPIIDALYKLLQEIKQ